MAHIQRHRIAEATDIKISNNNTEKTKRKQKLKDTFQSVFIILLVNTK